MGPAQAREAAPEGARDSWWEESLGVVEASRCGVAACGFVKRQEALPALSRRACGGIVKQVSFRGESLQDGHGYARTVSAGVIFAQGRCGCDFPA